MSRSRNRYYLNKREGKLFGVCAGFADYLGIDALWVRVAVVALTVLGSFVTIPLYFIIAFLASSRPEEIAWHGDRDGEAYLDRLTTPRQDRSARLRSDISDMDRRLAEMETIYSGNSRLSSEIDRLR